ncbi:MAG TPA: SH3 domain-containing protein [Cytophagaceae bacterium]|nr:SH3 domain-containing protein [Cytophagaceae bacterium]
MVSADSLFEKKQYTESMELYERFFHSGYYTPRMLIRLSLIKEGLGDYTYALYYLNVYYTKIPDKSVLKKMDELAARYNLEGYDYNDLVFFISLYHRYYIYIVFAFLGASLLFLIYLYIKKLEGSGMGLRPLLFMLILGAVYVISNYDIIPEKAIVNSDASLMSAASSGADLLGHIKKGHRVTIKSRKDIWCKIEWHGQIAFVRENNLLFPVGK